MKQVLVRQGDIVVQEVPTPVVEPGTVLVAVGWSTISVGTEVSGVGAPALPLWKRALREPAKVVKVAKMVAEHGVEGARREVESRLSLATPTGYSAAGTVIEVGEGVEDLEPGQRVACAGAGLANHAEVVRVPRHLVVPVPDGLDMRDASTVTLGAIALQGVRRANTTLGETFVVIGLGLLGQLTVQMLKADGCHVVGMDLDRERIAQALAAGMDVGLHPDDADTTAQVQRLTAGIGADGVIITAAGRSSEVVSTAFRMCRKKGRVVLVGDVGLDLRREDLYAKELDFFMSTSYGPGRYDRRYEEEGVDYPVGYVRWTENRNMAEYLSLLSEGRVRLDALTTRTFPVDEAAAAYEAVRGGEERPVLVLLDYPRPLEARVERVVTNPLARRAKAGAISVGIIGAGQFARGVHLPNIKEMDELFHLSAVATRTGHSADEVAKLFGADRATTDYRTILDDPSIEAVIIATRHDSHARLTLEALQAGKHVLVEKPLALTRAELQSIVDFYGSSDEDKPLLLTGFNRRFSRYAERVARLTAERSAPMMLTYQMNAGFVPADSWIHGAQGGGRNIGEACHIYDLFTYVTQAEVVDVSTQRIAIEKGHYGPRDNFATSMRFSDGSVASLTYTSLGTPGYPKERMQVFCDGSVLEMDDFRRLSVYGRRDAGLQTAEPEKGQREELIAFARAIREGGEWPNPLWQQVQAMRIAFEVEEQLGE